VVTLGASVLERFAALSLYNSPYPAHDAGHAIDLYPGDGGAPSPVAGEVVETKTVTGPSSTFGTDTDHLVLIDTGGLLARVMHVDPAVAAGDRVSVGDSLGETIRSGYFDPWVDDHLHLGFRSPDANPYRATGSRPVAIDTPVEPVSWDGTGRVIERAETFALLEGPAHPAPGECFAGIAVTGGVLDGGAPHYERGGVIGAGGAGRGQPVAIEGVDAGEDRLVGHVAGDGRTVSWRPVDLRANGRPIRGLSLALWRDRIAVKLIGGANLPPVGDDVSVTVDY